MSDRLREAQELIADSLNEPIFHVKTERGEWMGGWQAFVNWTVIDRPRVIRITAVEWEDLSDLDEDIEDALGASLGHEEI